jgi:hypothetical protein
MREWIPIKYLGFWDVPRNFLVRHEGTLYLFDCPFIEADDDYSTSYAVYLMPDLSPDEYDEDWSALPRRAIRKIGDVVVADVRFDPTRRNAIGAEVFDAFHPSAQANGEQSNAKPGSRVR